MPARSNSSRPKSSAKGPAASLQTNQLTSLTDTSETLGEKKPKSFHQVYIQLSNKNKFPIIPLLKEPSKHLYLDLALLSKNQWKAFTSSLKNSVVDFESVHIAFGKCKDLGLFRDLNGTVSLSKSFTTPSDGSRKPSEILKHYEHFQTARKQAAMGKSQSKQNDNKDLISHLDSTMGQQVVNALCTHLITGSLKTLKLEGFVDGLNAQNWKTIAATLKTKCCDSLKILSLADSELGDESFSAFGSVLKSLKFIEQLNVSGCKLTSDSLKYIVGLLKIHHEISITDNWVSSLRGREHGFESYESETKGLQVLNLSNNFFADETCKLLLRNLEEDTKLRVLYLQNNLIKEGGIALFDDFLSRCTTTNLQLVHLGANLGSRSYIEHIQDTSVLSADMGDDALCFIRVQQPHLHFVSSRPSSHPGGKHIHLRSKQAEGSSIQDNKLKERVTSLETTLQEKEEENSQLRSIVESLVEKIKHYKQKCSKLSRNLKEKKLENRKKFQTISHTSEGGQVATLESLSGIPTRDDTSANDDVLSKKNNLEIDTNQRISQIVVDIPMPQNSASEEENMYSNDSISKYDRLSLEEIEQQLATEDISTNPQIAVIQELAANLKMLTSVVNNLETSNSRSKVIELNYENEESSNRDQSQESQKSHFETLTNVNELNHEYKQYTSQVEVDIQGQNIIYSDDSTEGEDFDREEMLAIMKSRAKAILGTTF